MDPDERLAPHRVDAFILAGGRSRRMGADKARLPWNGRPLALVLRDAVAASVRQVWLVTKPDSALEDLEIPILYDATPQPALVHGIRTALAASGPEWRFVLACDMPGVGPGTLAALWNAARRGAAPGSFPRLGPDREPEPVPSLWHRDVAARIGPDWGITARDWVRLAGLAPWGVPPDQVAGLANVNTKAEWEEWQCRPRDAAPE